MKTLDQVKIGAKARVVEVSGDDSLQQRMLEMGLMPGTEVQVVREAPLGDPIEIKLMGYSLSLRKSEAKHVGVEDLG
jgi:Fe2+ transport system protein FeoA